MGESLSLGSGVPHAGHGPRSPGCGPSGWTSHLSLMVWLVMQTIWGVDRQGWPCGGGDGHRRSGVQALLRPRVTLKHSGPGNFPRVSRLGRGDQAPQPGA